MPTNLGNLPSDKLAPIAKAEINRGTDYGYYQIAGNAAEQPLPDGASNGYRIVRTLDRPAYLVAEFSTLIQGTRAAWDAAYIWVAISPADLDGVAQGNLLLAPLNGDIPPRTFTAMYPFRCGPGTYTVYAQWSSGSYTTAYWINRVYSRLTVDVVGDGLS